MARQSRARKLAKRALPKRLLARRRREYQTALARKRTPLKDLRRLMRAHQRAAAAAHNQFIAAYRDVTGVTEKGENDG